MNETLLLAEKILAVLDESNQTLESRLAATEIVVKLLTAAPYGSLAQISRGAKHTEAASPSHCTAHSEHLPLPPRQSLHSEGKDVKVAQP
jgi:hypothetical protein